MRNLKKILALVLALVMSLSLMATAGAASFPDVADDNAYKTAIDVLNGVKVFQGYDNGARFEPAGNITRAEVAAIIYRISTGDVNDTQKDIYTAWNGAGKLSDVTTGWYAGYVNFCSNAGYIKGYPDKTFKPQNNVTGYEVLAMILRAVGYGRNGEFEGSQWAITTASLAQTLGITKNVKEDLGAPATRQMVAEILFRAIFCETQKYNALHLYEGTGTNLARENLSLEEVEGVVIANEYANLEGSKTLADGKTLVRDEKNEKDYTINWSTNLDDMGESRMIYIQSKTNVISLADSGKNAKAESTDAEKVSAILTKAGISAGDAEKFLNFDKAFKRDSEYKLKYVLNVDKNGKIGTLTPDEVEWRIDEAFGDNRAKVAADGKSVEATIKPHESITKVDMDYMESIFAKADLTGKDKDETIIDGEIYVGTQSTNDISDVKPDQKYSWESFCEEFILETENDQAFTANDNGNWVKVIDNDGDGAADYIFKVIYTVAQVTRVKDDKITLDTKDHTLSTRDNKNNIVVCSDNEINNLTDEKVVSADELAVDDVVYYAVIENKAQTYKAAMETATFKDVSRNGKTAVTTEGTEWTQSDVHEHIEDEAFAQDVRGLAGKVSYDCYFDRGGYLAAYAKTDKVGDFKLITDGWFNALKNRNDEYAVNAYNDAESKLEVVDITKYGDLFITPVSVKNNGWNGLKFLGDTSDEYVATKTPGGADNNSANNNTTPAALNGGATAGTNNDEIHTTVAAITADGTILPVHDASVTGRYAHEMIDLYNPGNVNNINDGKAVIPTMAAVEGTIYRTSDGSDTAYDSEGNDVQVRALSSTIYYVVWGSNANAKVRAAVGFDNAPDMKTLNKLGLIEDIYCVGTRRAADNDTDDVTYSADVVVIELNGAYPNEGEPFFVVDNDWRKTDIGDYRVDGIDSKGEKVEDMRVAGFKTADRFAYAGSGTAGYKQITAGLYWRYPTATEGTYTLQPMSGEDIAAYFSVGTVVEESWTNESYIVMRSWNQDTLDVNRADADGILKKSDEAQYKITGAALYTLAYGGDDYDDYAAELEKADLEDVVDRQVDDYVVDDKDTSNDKNRDTWFVDRHNIHYYNRNKVLVFHNDSDKAIWAVSMANVVDGGDNWDDMDLAFDIWRTIVGKVPADIVSGTEITVVGQDYAKATGWADDTETAKVKVAKGLNVSAVIGNTAYASAKDGVELTLTAPVGKKFYKDNVTNKVSVEFETKSASKDAAIYKETLSGDSRTLQLVLKGITSDMTLRIGLEDDATNLPKIVITDTKLKTAKTVSAGNTLNDVGTITFTHANDNALTANDTVTVNSVSMGDTKLTRDALQNGYIVDGNTVILKGTAAVTEDITIDATLTSKTEETIELVAAAGAGKTVSGEALTQFTISGATIDGQSKKAEGVESYPATGSKFTFKVPVGKSLFVTLAGADGYTYSDDITIDATPASGVTTFTVSAGSTSTVVIDSAARYVNADKKTAPKLGDTTLTNGADTEAAALEKAVQVQMAENDKTVYPEKAAYHDSYEKTVNNQTYTVYKVIAEDKTVQYYAVQITEKPANPNVAAGNEVTATPSVNATTGAATSAPSKADVDKAIAGAKADERTTAVSIDATSSNTGVKSTEVALGKDSVDALIKEEGVTEVTIKTNNGDVTVPTGALNEIIKAPANADKVDDSLKLVVAEAEKDDVQEAVKNNKSITAEQVKAAVVVEVKVVNSQNDEVEVKDLSASNKLTLKLDAPAAAKDGDKIDVYFLNGTALELIQANAPVENGKVTVKVNHLTVFALIPREPTDAEKLADVKAKLEAAIAAHGEYVAYDNGAAYWISKTEAEANKGTEGAYWVYLVDGAIDNNVTAKAALSYELKKVLKDTGYDVSVGQMTEGEATTADGWPNRGGSATRQITAKILKTTDSGRVPTEATVTATLKVISVVNRDEDRQTQEAAIRAAAAMDLTSSNASARTRTLLGDQEGRISAKAENGSYTVYLKKGSLTKIEKTAKSLNADLEKALIEWWNGGGDYAEKDGVITITNSSKEPNAKIIYDPKATKDVAQGTNNEGVTTWTYKSILGDLFLNAEGHTRNLKNADAGYIVGYEVGGKWYVVEIDASKATFDDTTKIDQDSVAFHIVVVDDAQWPNV